MTLLIVWGALSALLCTALVAVVAAQWSARAAGRLRGRHAAAVKPARRLPQAA